MFFTENEIEKSCENIGFCYLSDPRSHTRDRDRGAVYLLIGKGFWL